MLLRIHRVRGEAMTDHLLAAFAPDDSRATDRLVHEEWTVALTCSCGVAATTAANLDRHFLAVFTPADQIGRDGRAHRVVGEEGVGTGGNPW
jgi:hypothetical protein